MFGSQPMTAPSVRSGFMILTASILVPEVQYGMAIHKNARWANTSASKTVPLFLVLAPSPHYNTTLRKFNKIA